MQSFSAFEQTLMKVLLVRATAYKACTYPNPAVAAVIYKGTQIIAWGEHQKKGDDHAEVVALKKAQACVKGATLMVTLEPCTHHGSTPPCVDAIVKAGIATVIFAVEDPNPLVRQRPAMPYLTAQGIQVKQGLLAAEASALNRYYIHMHHKKRPFVHLKAAITLDGKLTVPQKNPAQQPYYLSNHRALETVHRYRLEHAGIVIGKQTLLIDNPQLTIRHVPLPPGACTPWLLVLGNNLPDVRNYRLFQSGYRTVLVTSQAVSPEVQAAFTAIWTVPADIKEPHRLSWPHFLARAATENLQSLLLEGGSDLYSQAMLSQTVDRYTFFVVPALGGEEGTVALTRHFGGKEGVFPHAFSDAAITPLGDQVAVTGYCQTPPFSLR